MHFLTKLFKFYLDSSIHVALSVYALTWISLTKFNLEYNEPLLYFNFYGTIVGYNFVKYSQFIFTKQWLKSLRGVGLLIISLICLALTVFYGKSLSESTFPYILLGLLLTVIYIVPIPLLSRSLRYIPGLKVYVIATVWSVVTVVLPVVNADIAFAEDVVLLFLQNIILVMVLMLPFEIRDVNDDEVSLHTIPQQIGIKATKTLGVALLVAFMVCELLKNEFSYSIFLVNAFVILILTLLLIKSKENQSYWYSAFWVEAIPVFWLILLQFNSFL